MKRPFLLFALIAFLISCGKDQDNSSAGNSSVMEKEEIMTDGSYKAILRPMNFHVNGFFAYGNAEFELSGDSLQVITYLDDDAPVSHLQSIHRGTRCPTMVDDTNRDGTLDIKEAFAVAGPIIVPLDGDLNSREAGKGIYPKGSSFTYNASASFSEMMKELGNDISLVGKVIMIHGTADRESVPVTVTSIDGMPRHLSIPMVCGVIRRVLRP